MKKNLRKLLVLVLVFAMVLSVSAIGASAAFTDTKSSKYGEAIDVLSNIGVLGGMTSTTFEPTGNLTREQAAKIITYLMLGPVNAALINTATSQKFTDVAPDRWSAGYIEYCANQGIIGGYGNGKFGPTDPLTSAAFTKMLLAAVGYNASAEGISGSGWANVVASLALRAGIYDTTIVISNSVNMNREQAAQLAFKALTATMVQYSGGTSIKVGDTTITTGALRSNVTYTVPSVTAVKYNGVDDGNVQFCEQYFSKLSYSNTAADADAFGRPAHTWTNNTTLIGKYANTPVVTYTGSKIGFENNIAADLNGYKLDGKYVENQTLYNTVNTVASLLKGNPASANFTYGVITGSGETMAAAIAGETANGRLVEVFADTNKNITTIVEVSYQVGTVTNVTTATGKTTYELTQFGGAPASFVDYTDNAIFVDTITGPSTLAKGDIVTFVVISGHAYVYPTTKVTGTATSVGSIYGSLNVTIAGKNYTVGADVAGISSFTASTTAADYYLDQYGFVVRTSAAAAYGDYAFVVRQFSKLTTDVNGTVPSTQVIVTKADGTVGVYNLALTRLTTGGTYRYWNGAAYDLYTAVAGDYIIKGTDLCAYKAADLTVDTGFQAQMARFLATNPVVGYAITDTSTINVQSLTAASASMTPGVKYLAAGTTGSAVTGLTSGGGTALLTSSTKYVIYNPTTGTAAIFVGNAGLPASTTIAGSQIVITADNAGVGTANLVFASVPGGIGVASTGNYVYIDTNMFSTSLGTTGNTVWTYTGYKADGTTLSLTSATQLTPGFVTPDSGVYYYNADNTVGAVKAKAANTANADHAAGFIFDATLQVIGSMLSVTSSSDGSEHYYNITSDTKVVYVNPTLSSINNNGGFVVLSVVNGQVTANVATIYVIAD